MGIRQLVRKYTYSLLVHSGLRDLGLARSLRSFAASFVAPMDFRSAQRTLASDPDLSSQERSLLKQVSLHVHRNDEMYMPFDARHYLSTGLSAMRCIESALQKAVGGQAVRSILDFPCGYGRVLRFLRARFPDAEITVSELDKAALAFCKESFYVKTVESTTDFSKLSVAGSFDLIWCGSLLTHVDENSAAELLKFFRDHLSPGGRVLFTTHGRHPVHSIRKTRRAYGLTDAARQDLLSQYDARGYGYADYPGRPGYGVSVASPDRMDSIARSVGPWKDVSFLERGWDNHQDVYIGEME
jgi:SAM-dependent methyltransferase